MPDYSVSAAGQALVATQEMQGCANNTIPYQPYMSTIGAVTAATPFRHDSWEVMTNIERFDDLKGQVLRLQDKTERMGETIYKLQGLLEQHRHSAADGSVMVNYSRDRF